MFPQQYSITKCWPRENKIVVLLLIDAIINIKTYLSKVYPYHHPPYQSEMTIASVTTLNWSLII